MVTNIDERAYSDVAIPPGELLADHERMQAYFSGVLEIVNEVRLLREDSDLDAARFELQKVDNLFCDARASFESAEFKAAVAVYFSGFPGPCGGARF